MRNSRKNFQKRYDRLCGEVTYSVRPEVPELSEVPETR
jgi:hypothetical protein